jgi:maltose O-acetyltransferase
MLSFVSQASKSFLSRFFSAAGTKILSEREKMEKGMLYNSFGDELFNMRQKAKVLCREFNNSDPLDLENRHRLLQKLFNAECPGLFIEPPFYIDFGVYTELGKNVYMNYNCCILDVCKVKIGDYTLFAPNVQIYAATHPIDGNIRMEGLELGAPVTIGKNCWIGGHSVILPGVTIGDNCVVGGGSVVSRDVPSNSVVVGNPARVIRKVPPLDPKWGLDKESAVPK